MTSIITKDTQLVRVFTSQIGGIPANVCDARELHFFLQSGDKFADWIKTRIKQYGFEEHRDFCRFSEKAEKLRGGRPSTEYHLTLDMAKELSMVENNEQGRRARRYFIGMERAAIQSATQIIQELTELRAALMASNPTYARIARYTQMGLAGWEIARILNYSPGTVRVYKSKMRRLGVLPAFRQAQGGATQTKGQPQQLLLGGVQ